MQRWWTLKGEMLAELYDRFQTGANPQSESEELVSALRNMPSISLNAVESRHESHCQAETVEERRASERI